MKFKIFACFVAILLVFQCRIHHNHRHQVGVNLLESQMCNRDIQNYVYEPKSNFDVVTEQQKSDPEYAEIFSIPINWTSGSSYKLDKDNYLGGGTFSDVYQGKNKDTNQNVVLKYFNSERWEYVAQIEVKIQETLGLDGPSVQKYYGAFRTESDDYPFCLVYEYAGDTSLDHAIYHNQIKKDEIPTYQYQLLQALDFAHKKGIVHLDVKPANIVIDKENTKLTLIDWGISEFIIKNKEQERRGTYEFSAPEALLEYKCCDFTLDSWSAGTILAAMMFNKAVPFNIDNNSQFDRERGEILANIADVIGKQDLKDMQDKYSIQMKEDIVDHFLHFSRRSEPIGFEKGFGNDDTKYRETEDGLDLLKQLLTIDFEKRISPGQALQHKYFDNVRSQFTDGQQAQQIVQNTNVDDDSSNQRDVLKNDQQNEQTDVQQGYVMDLDKLQKQNTDQQVDETDQQNKQVKQIVLEFKTLNSPNKDSSQIKIKKKNNKKNDKQYSLDSKVLFQEDIQQVEQANDQQIIVASSNLRKQK